MYCHEGAHVHTLFPVPGSQTQSRPRCIHCPGTQTLGRWARRCGGTSQWPGTHCQPLLQVQYPATQTCRGEGAAMMTSCRGGGGACRTTTSGATRRGGTEGTVS